MKQTLSQINADIVVVDFATGFGGMAADELNLPTICLCSAPLKNLERLWQLHSPTEERMCTVCGIICILPTLMDSEIANYYSNTLGGGDYAKFYKSQIKRTVLCNSFYGFDKSIHLPPNVYLTGPHLQKENEELKDLIYNLDRPLAQWLDDAHAKNEKVLYVSLGSELNWGSWYVDAIYRGIVQLDKDVPCRAIFVLPENVTLPSGATPTAKFWPTKSVPQAELLAHPAIKSGLSHCDFFTTLDFINAGKPLLTFPHYGDQVTNA